MSAPPDLPHIVQRAFDVCRQAGYVAFCRNETGRLLATLAATRGGTMAEFGTGCGVGTAWLRSGVRNGARILTAELDESLAGAASQIFTDDEKVEVLAADWSVLREHGPFSLLFLDSGSPSEVGVDAVIDLVEPGGIVVLDDFAPCESWPPITYGRVDTLREQWLTDERFTAVEDRPVAEPPGDPPHGQQRVGPVRRHAPHPSRASAAVPARSQRRVAMTADASTATITSTAVNRSSVSHCSRSVSTRP